MLISEVGIRENYFFCQIDKKIKLILYVNCSRYKGRPSLYKDKNTWRVYEDKFNIIEIATLLQELQVETFRFMEKGEKWNLSLNK